MKVENKQRQYSREIVNEDSIFKMLAFDAAREQALEKNEETVAGSAQ